MPNPRLRLFCFPYSGGTAAIYRSWPEYFGSDVEIAAIELPGRAWRRHEPPLTSLLEASQRCVEGLQALTDVPFMLYGHSMGGLLAFEVARTLREYGLSMNW